MQEKTIVICGSSLSSSLDIDKIIKSRSDWRKARRSISNHRQVEWIWSDQPDHLTFDDADHYIPLVWERFRGEYEDMVLNEIDWFDTYFAETIPLDCNRHRLRARDKAYRSLYNGEKSSNGAALKYVIGGFFDRLSIHYEYEMPNANGNNIDIYVGATASWLQLETTARERYRAILHVHDSCPVKTFFCTLDAQLRDKVFEECAASKVTIVCSKENKNRYYHGRKNVITFGEMVRLISHKMDRPNISKQCTTVFVKPDCKAGIIPVIPKQIKKASDGRERKIVACEY